MYSMKICHPFREEKKERILAGEEKTILYFEVYGVAFLYRIGADIYPDVELIWLIGGEVIQNKIGSIENPAYYDPPYLVDSYVEIRAKNLGGEKEIRALIEGLVYGQIVIREKQKEDSKLVELVEVVREIKNKLDEERTEGKSFDIKVDVTDKIKMLKDLNWTACTITNAGNNDIYFCVNEWKRPEAPLEPNLTANIDFGKKNAIKKIYLYCDKGKTSTAYIRVLK